MLLVVTSVSQRQLLILLQCFTVRVISPLEQDFIGNRLHGTDVSEFIHARYESLVKFLQEFKKQGIPPVTGDSTRPSELPGESRRT
jgi:hypothetical protein